MRITSDHGILRFGDLEVGMKFRFFFDTGGFRLSDLCVKTAKTRYKNAAVSNATAHRTSAKAKVRVEA